MNRRRPRDRSRWESAPEQSHHAGMYPQDERRAWIPGSAPEHAPNPSGERYSQDQGEFDPEYRQWREEQLRRFDEDYRNWRKERYRKFSEEFDAWRRSRQGAQHSGASTAQSIGTGQGGGAGGFGSATVGGGEAPDAGAGSESGSRAPTDVGLSKGG